MKNFFKLRLRSMAYALSGLKFAVRSQPNMRLHLAAALSVLFMGAVLRVDAGDWRWLLLCIALVWVAEILNTAIEQACNALTLEWRREIGHAKDLGAAAVLLAVIFAIAIGSFTLLPYLGVG